MASSSAGGTSPQAECRRRWLNPVDVGEGGQLEVVQPLPGAVVADQLGLVQPDGRFGDGVVIRVAFGPDRGEDAGVGEPFAVADRQVLGGFKGSSQHLEVEVDVWDDRGGLGGRGGRKAADAVAGAAATSAACGTRVLAADR